MAGYFYTKQISKTFAKDQQQITVLRGIDLEVASGESVVITGPSGAGKSTFLHILGTLEVPSSGKLFYQNEDVFSKKESAISAFRNQKIGFIFQFHHLIAMLSALENVMLPLLIRQVSQEIARRKAEEMLARVGLAERLKHRPAELSGGEQQRVAIARALVGEPEILLGDEPTGNLDTKTGKQIQDLLMELKRERKLTLVVVTHDTSMLSRFERHLSMQDGLLMEP